MEEAHYDEDPYGHDQGYYLVPDEQGDYDLDEGEYRREEEEEAAYQAQLALLSAATLES